MYFGESVPGISKLKWIVVSPGRMPLLGAMTQGLRTRDAGCGTDLWPSRKLR